MNGMVPSTGILKIDGSNLYVYESSPLENISYRLFRRRDFVSKHETPAIEAALNISTSHHSAKPSHFRAYTAEVGMSQR